MSTACFNHIDRTILTDFWRKLRTGWSNGFLWKPQERIALELGVEQTYVSRRIRRLVRLGYLTITRLWRRGYCQRYRLNLDAAAQAQIDALNREAALRRGKVSPASPDGGSSMKGAPSPCEAAAVVRVEGQPRRKRVAQTSQGEAQASAYQDEGAPGPLGSLLSPEEFRNKLRAEARAKNFDWDDWLDVLRGCRARMARRW